MSVQPLDPAGDNVDYIGGSSEEIADSLRTFREAGFTQVDLMVEPGTVQAFDALAPVVELLRAD